MGKNDVHLVMSAQEAQMVQAWMNARNSVKDFQNQVAAVGSQGKKSSDDMEKHFSRAIKEIRRGFLALFGVQGLQSTVRTFFGMIRNEFAAVRQEGETALGIQRDFGREMKAIQMMQPKGSDIATEDLAKIIQENTAGMDPAAMARLVRGAITSGQGPDVRQRAMVPIEIREILAAYDEQTNEAAVGAIVAAIERIPGASTQEIAGLLYSGLSASPSGSGGESAMFAQNIFNAATEALSKGYTLKEALTFLIAAQQKGADKQGTVPATNFRNLNEQISEKLFERGIKDVRPGGMNPIQFIQQTKIGQEIGAELLGIFRKEAFVAGKRVDLAESRDERMELEARAKGKQALVELLQPAGVDNVTKQFFREASGVILEGKEGIEFFKRQSESLRTLRAAATENLSRDLDEFLNSIRSKSAGGVRAAVRKFMRDSAVAMGGLSLEGEFNAFVEQLQGQAGLTSNEVTIRAIRQLREFMQSKIQRRISQIQAPRMEVPGGAMGMAVSEFPSREEVESQIRRDAVIQDGRRLIEKLGTLADGLDRNTEATEGNTRATAGQPDAQPANNAEPVGAIPGAGE